MAKRPMNIMKNDAAPMAHVRIENFRCGEWIVRQEGEAEITADDLRAMLPGYALNHPARAFHNGSLIGECRRQTARQIEARA